MRAVIQRVSEAGVSVNGKETGRIGKGILIFLGIGPDDGPEDVRYLAEKAAHLRIFSDEADKMNLSVLDVGGGALVISQFTLLGDCRKGRRPSYTAAAPPETAKKLYDAFVLELRNYCRSVETGIFQETMAVHLINDGPVTLLLDSKRNF